MGIDPGLAILGYGVIEWKGKKCTLLAEGTITTSSKDNFDKRLKYICESLINIFTLYKPESISVEEPIYCKNVQTALTLGKVSGGIIISAAEKNIPVFEISPLEIKQAIVGHGRASKDQVQNMVMRLLGISEFKGSEHSSDAIAAAICYAHTETYRKHLLSQGSIRKKRGSKWLRTLKEPSSKKQLIK